MTRPCAPRISRWSVGTDLAFRGPDTGNLGVGRIAQEQVHTGVAEPRHARQVGRLAVGRRLVELDVTGMQHGARTGVDRDRQTAGNGVVDGEVLALENAVRRTLALVNLLEHRLDPVFAAFLVHQRQRELRSDHRNVGAQLEQERDGTDVVLVRVGEHERLDVFEAVLDQAQVRKDQIDTGLIVRREQHPAVHDQQTAQMLENRHIAADFADATQRGDPQSPWGQRPRRCEFFVH